MKPEAQVGTGELLLVTAAITGWVTAITMVGPLLVDLSRDLDVPLARLGLLGAAISLPWALGAPFTGLLSDRLGRRPLMVLALCGVGAASIASSFVDNFGALLATRLWAGAFGAFGPASTMAAVGDLVPLERRGYAMGYLNLGFGLAAVAGVPAVGVIAGVYGWRWAFAVTGAMLLALALLVRLAFPSPKPTGHAAGGLRATYSAVLGVPFLGNVLTANLLERAIFNAAVLFLPSFLMLSYGLNPAEVAPALAVVAVGTIGGNTLGSWLGDRFRRAAIFVVAQTCAGLVGLALFGLTPGLLVSVIIGGTFGLANAASRPAFLALGSELSPRHRGALLGVLSLTNQGGAVLGSVLGGLVLALAGYPGVAIMTMLGGLAAAMLALPLAWRTALR
ncbi:MAG TPA: MFS transporter [Chloroflexota bacterium]|nr:MFS transporter [Chloroflexota bacterium]